MSNINIYGLLNPLTNQYFYVGMTSQELRIRLNCHMNLSNKIDKKVKVIQSILNYGERPQIILLQVTDTIYGSSDIELFWMKKLLSEGHPLVNKSYNKQGRKPAENPKVQISLYLTNEQIAKFGGVDKFKDIIYKFIDEYEPPVLHEISEANSVLEIENIVREIKKDTIPDWQKNKLEKIAIEKSKTFDF